MWQGTGQLMMVNEPTVEHWEKKNNMSAVWCSEVHAVVKGGKRVGNFFKSFATWRSLFSCSASVPALCT